MPNFAFWLSLAGSLALVLSAALALQLVPGIGLYGKKRAERMARQPFVDLYVFGLIASPWVVCVLVAGFPGLLGSFAGQILAAFAWSIMHTFSQNKRDRGVSPIKAVSRQIGLFRVYAGLCLTLAALPVLVVMRVCQLMVWPLYARVMKLPREPQSSYFSFTRHQSKGITGADLLWALYTEWAVGVWSQSGQIVRHSASIWCPMRFSDDAKNQACAVDFPDVERWAEHGSLAGTVRLIEQMHSSGSTAWFGHPSRGVAPTPAPDETNSTKQAA